MFRIASLVLLTLFLSALASPLSADEADCDNLFADENAPKGLFGLCIAYYNSVNGNGRDRVEQLFAKKAIAAGYDPVIPGTGPEVDTTLLDCPCWQAEELRAAVNDDRGIENCGTITDSWGVSDRFELGSGFDVLVSFEAGANYCFYANAITYGWEDERVGTNGVEQEDIDACHQQLRQITEEEGVYCSFD